MRKSQLVALLILIIPLALTACGQKGPLYLTADPDSEAVVADAVETEEETKEEKPQDSD